MSKKKSEKEYSIIVALLGNSGGRRMAYFFACLKSESLYQV